MPENIKEKPSKEESSPPPCKSRKHSERDTKKRSFSEKEESPENQEAISQVDKTKITGKRKGKRGEITKELTEIQKEVDQGTDDEKTSPTYPFRGRKCN